VNNQSTKQQIVPLLTSTAEYYQRKLTPSILEAYCDALNRYPIDRILQARDAHYQDPDHGQFFPKVADFVKHLRSTEPQRNYDSPKHVDSPAAKLAHAMRMRELLAAQGATELVSMWAEQAMKLKVELQQAGNS